jgi:hypothetical protein
MRCAIANKVFYKVNEPHVAYYLNPNGISTNPNTRGVVEGHSIMQKYGRRLVPERMFAERKAFVTEICQLSGQNLESVPSNDYYDLAQQALEQLSHLQSVKTADVSARPI